MQTGLSRTLIYREVERGHLRAYKVGGRLRITPDALAEWKRFHAIGVRSERPTYEPAMPSERDRARDLFAAELEAIRAGRAA